MSCTFLQQHTSSPQTQFSQDEQSRTQSYVCYSGVAYIRPDLSFQLIGPPGVGKTAILEGLASRIVAKEVPESLHNKRVLSIDLASIMAGSGIRGQFEEKFKALLRDIEDEAGNVICFIDEVRECLRNPCTVAYLNAPQIPFSIWARRKALSTRGR